METAKELKTSREPKRHRDLLRLQAPLLSSLVEERETRLAGGGVPLSKRVLDMIPPTWTKSSELAKLFANPDYRNKGPRKLVGGHRGGWYVMIRKLYKARRIEIASDGRQLWVRTPARKAKTLKMVSN